MAKKIILAVLLVALLAAIFAIPRLLGSTVDPTEPEQTEESLPPGVENWFTGDEEEETSETEAEAVTDGADQEQTDGPTDAAAEENNVADATNPTTGSGTADSTKPTTGSNAADATNPTVGGGSSQPTNPTTGGNATQPTKPDSNQEEATEATAPAPTNPAPAKLSYEQYEAMSAAQQREFMMSFADVEDFFDWYNDAKAEYEKQHPDIEIEDGKVEIGKQP